MGIYMHAAAWVEAYWWVIVAVLVGEWIGFSIPEVTRRFAFFLVILTVGIPSAVLCAIVVCQWFFKWLINLVGGAHLVATIGIVLIAVAVCAIIGLTAQKLLAKAYKPSQNSDGTVSRP